MFSTWYIFMMEKSIQGENNVPILAFSYSLQNFILKDIFCAYRKVYLSLCMCVWVHKCVHFHNSNRSALHFLWCSLTFLLDMDWKSFHLSTWRVSRFFLRISQFFFFLVDVQKLIWIILSFWWTFRLFY